MKTQTLITHKGYEIFVITPATQEQFGYFIDHHDFADERFSTVQEAVNAINQKEGESNEPIHIFTPTL